MSNHCDAKNKNTCAMSVKADAGRSNPHQMADKKAGSQDRQRHNQNEKHHGKGREDKKR